MVTTDGTTWATGLNNHGELGDETTTTRFSPVQVIDNVASVAGGETFSMFLKTDGTVWGAGLNDVGQLGNGNTTNQQVPVQVMSGVSQIATGDDHTVFVKTDGTVIWDVPTGLPSEFAVTTFRVHRQLRRLQFSVAACRRRSP